MAIKPEKKADPAAGDDDQGKKPAAGKKEDVKPEDEGKKPTNSGDEGDKGEDEPEDEGDNGEEEDVDWRIEAAGGDEKLLTRLKRFDSLSAMGKSLDAAEKKLRERGGATPLADDASAEDKAAWYSANLKRPEKVEAYAEALQPVLPEGEEYSEDEEQVLGAVTQRLHDSGVLGLDAMQAVHQVFADVIVGARKEAEKQAQTAADNARQALEKVWTRGDVDRNIRYANAAARMFADRAGVDANVIANKKLANGGLLGNDPDYARLLAAVGREHSEDPGFLELADSRKDSIKALMARKDEIMAMRNGAPKEKTAYQSEAIQKELKQIIANEKEFAKRKAR